MARTMRSAAIAALTALAAVAAIIAVDFTAPISAQSDDEIAGRIVARRLDDGYVEFGWQPAGNERILPHLRHFPPDARVDHWLNSSTVEVEGTEIGRVNARLRSDGKIEFAFTPIDGERIEPRARYFPVDAGVGRWFHSAQITFTIGPPTDVPGYSAVSTRSYTTVSAGYSHTCAIRTNGAVECWGLNDHGQTDAPYGTFRAVSAGYVHTCAIRAGTGAIECWGFNHFDFVSGLTDAPDGSYTAISAGGMHTCAIRDTGGIACWGIRSGDGYDYWRGSYDYWQSDTPSGRYTAVSAGDGHACAIRDTGEIVCWADNRYGSQADAPEGSFIAVGAGGLRTCAIHTDDGAIECWGGNKLEQIQAPEGSFTAVGVSDYHGCAIHESDGAIECWGLTEHPPDGNYTAVSVGRGHACAIRESSGQLACWGSNHYGQTDVPTHRAP